MSVVPTRSAGSIIRADTDQLRAVARQMRTTADEITNGASAMHQAMGALDATWSGSARDRGIARWGEITPKYPPAVERLIHFANELEALAQRLDDAAAVFGGGLSFSTSGGARNVIGKGVNVGNGSEGEKPWYMNPKAWSEIKDDIFTGRDSIDLLKNVYLAATKLSFRPGERYPGQYFVKGGDETLRTDLGLPTHLAQIKVSSGLGNLLNGENWALGRRIANQQVGETLQSGSFKAGVVLDVVLNGWKNWNTYGNQENAAAKIVAGTVIDTALSVGLGLGGQWVGAVAGTALGAAIGGPIGAVIGAQVGGFLGSAAGSWVGGWIGEQQGVKDAIGSAVDTGAKLAKDATEAGTRVVSNVVDTVRDQARKVDEGLHAVGNTISNFFKPRLSFFGG